MKTKTTILLLLLSINTWGGEYFPTADKYLKTAKTLESALESGDPLARIRIHNGGGTSVYMNALLCEKSVCNSEEDYTLLGAILSENSATKIVGEVYSYSLARILGSAHASGPGDFLELKGVALTKLKILLEQLDTSRFGKNKKENYQKILAFLNTSPRSLPCTYQAWEARPYDLDEAVKVSSDSPNLSHQIFKWVSATETQPQNTIQSASFYFSDVSSKIKNAEINPLEFSKAFSDLLIVDILAGQWDRFSGGNLQVQVYDEKVAPAFFDNGGTFSFGEGKRLQTYFTSVTRFKGETIERLKEMQKFVKGETSSFLGFTQVSELRNELRVGRTQDDSTWRNSMKRLDLLVDHIEKTCRENGMEKCAFN